MVQTILSAPDLWYIPQERFWIPHPRPPVVKSSNLSPYRRSSLAAAIGFALASGAAQAVDVGDESALRDAIVASAPNIRFANSITLSEDLPLIESDTTIAGAGFTLNGAGNRCIAAEYSNLTIDDLTISGCNHGSNSGGGVSVKYGDLSITNSTISGNTSDRHGGGVYVGSGNLELIESTVSGNTAADFGGGIAVKYGNVLIQQDSAVINNSARIGGGVYSYGGNSVEIEDSSISNNSATAGSGGREAVGGGLAAYYVDDLIVSSSTISNNTASAADAFAFGGGIFAYTDSTQISNSIISGNRAEGSAELLTGSLEPRVSGASRSELPERWRERLTNGRSSGFQLNNGFGGGGVLFSISSSEMIGSAITDNEAGLLGGGLLAAGPLSLETSTISGNRAAVGGGAVTGKYGFGPATVDSSTISGNSADFAAGLWAKYTAAIENSTISGNEAEFEVGGALLPTGSSLRFSTVFDNAAGELAGGLAANPRQEQDLRPRPAEPPTSLEIFASIVAGNLADQEPDLSVTDPGAGEPARAGSRADLEFNVSYSMIGEAPTSGTFNIDADSLVGIDPMLGPLGDNGGPTLTHLPQAGSPAATLIPIAVCDLVQDQRGLPRADGEGCSAGATEVSGLSQETTPPLPVPLMNRVGLALTAGLLALFGLLGLRRRRAT